MAVYSQNGWSANNDALMATYTVPTTDVRLTLRKGDASVVLLYVAEMFHKTVEPLRKEQCGGYNPRSVIGGRTISNHGSGTAEDLNWHKHARGAKGTFTAKQKAAVRKILAFVNAGGTVVRWGEDYKRAPVDGMHFEIIGSPTLTAKAADRIRAWRAGKTATAPSKAATAAAKTTKAPAWPKGTPAFRESKTARYSPTVEKWQARMKARGWRIEVDGGYGPKSADVAEAFQREKGLKADRLLGPITFAAAWTAKVTKS